jgi:hypothetical protein
LKALYGSIPIRPLLQGVGKKDMAIGSYAISWERLKADVLASDKAFDLLIEQHNFESKKVLKKVNAFERQLGAESQKMFKGAFYRKRESLDILETIAEKRKKYLAPRSSYESDPDTPQKFEATIVRYKQELLSKLKDRLDLSGDFEALFPFSNRQRHTYIIGGSGSGKSEFLKHFILHDISCKHGSLVIDPHGDLVKDLSKLSANKAEIIYISPEFGNIHLYPKFNPFEHEYHKKSPMEKQSFISVKSQELINAFEVVMGTEFSQNMRRIIFNCLQVLLNTEGMNLNDMLKFLRPSTSQPYEKLAKDHYNENVRLFFAHDFNLKTLSVTKQSVLTRFENAMANYHLFQIFDCKKSSFDLKKLLDKGKCILINASQGVLGEHGSKILGSFLVSEITTHALQRASIPAHRRRPLMIYIDECQNFLTERMDKILAEARKYSLHLTLANQFLSQIENTRLRNSILANTNIKCCGHTSAKDMETMSKEMKFDSKRIPKLGGGKFMIKVGSYSAIAVQSYGHLIEKKAPYYLDDTAHKERLNRTLKKYYAKVSLDQEHVQKAKEKQSFKIEKLL